MIASLLIHLKALASVGDNKKKCKKMPRERGTGVGGVEKESPMLVRIDKLTRF